MAKIEKKRVSILGCGWLGFPLAQRLKTADISQQIKGSTTSQSKLALFEAAGIEGYRFNLTPQFSVEKNEIASFLDSDILVISIPPKLAKTGQDFHTSQIEAVASALEGSPVKEIIYVSSTSIYPELNRTVTEDDVTSPEQSAAAAMVSAENLLLALRPSKTVSILRLGGLLGYERIPGKYVKGQKDMITGSIPVNYIHRDDAAGIIATIIEQGIVNGTFNVVAPFHPTRSEVYVSSCAQFGWEAPTFQKPDEIPGFKIISADKLSRFYEYSFLYPDPLDFHYEITE